MGEKHLGVRVTIDNIRRSLSAFFSWLGEEDNIIENQEKLVEVKKRIQSAGMFSREIGHYKKDIKNNWIQDTGAGLDLRIESRGVPILYRDVPISVTIRRVAFCRDFLFVRMV